MGKIIGIDLGTTNSVVAILEGGEPKVIPNKEGGRTTPSVVAFQDSGQRLVGGSAKRQAVTNPANTIFSIKRFMGRRHEEVGDEERMVPFDVVGAAKEFVKVKARGKEYTPPEISSYVLGYLKECAEDYLGEKVTEAVITVPAYFNDAQRQATKDAGKIAGLEVKRLVNEPTAAALAYGLNSGKTQKVAVYDFGGGTFDISILEIGEGVTEVLSTAGDTHLGGDDFDEALIHYVADEFKKDNGIDLRKDQMALQRLKEACEKAKCELSAAAETQLNLPFITADQSGPKHLMLTLTRSKFESLIADLVQRTKQPCEQSLRDAGLKPGDVDEVLLVGGSTRVPCVQALVKELFQRQPNRSVNPDEVVALGAAVQGGVMTGEVSDVVLLDVTSLSLGVEVQGGLMNVMIPRNTTIPTTKKETYTTASDSQPSVEIHVLQGERKMARNNRTLDKFHLDGIAPAPRGVPQVEVEFDIDADGILHVQATDKATGKEQKVRIEQSSGLSDDDISRMQEEAERFKEEDEKAARTAQARNEADNTVYQARKLLKDHEGKVEQEDAGRIEEKAKAVEGLLKGDVLDLAAVDSASEELKAAMSQLGEKLYRAAAEQQSAESGRRSGTQAGGESGSDEGDQVVDADYEVKE